MEGFPTVNLCKHKKDRDEVSHEVWKESYLCYITDFHSALQVWSSRRIIYHLKEDSYNFNDYKTAAAVCVLGHLK